MAFRVLIIEDRPDLRSLLHEHLHEAFAKRAHHGWPKGWPRDAEKHLEIEVLEEKELLGLCKLKSVAGVRNRLARRGEAPGVIITDLALSKGEVKKLDRQGGTDLTGAKDPSRQLESTTGFQIVKAMAPTVPVIATTFAANPLVLQACWKEGAHAVIPKPAPDEEMSAYYELWKLRRNPHAKLSAAQKKLGERWGPQIEAYLQEATHEVLKSVQARALKRVEEVVPQRLPYWLALDHERLDGQQIEGTSLMLLEIKGFSHLSRLGSSKPKAVFRMMNEIWNEVQPLLASSDAEVNHFAGDAALIFRGVYGEGDSPSQLRDTLNCGVEVSGLFELRGKVRTRLEEVIVEEYEAGPQKILETMKAYVEGLTGSGATGLNVRVISIEPPAKEALFGPIGATARWQHSTLYVDLLKETQEFLDMAQKEDPSLWLAGESFFLHRGTEPPSVPGFTIEPLRDVLKADLKARLPRARGLEIFRVFKAPDRELLA